MTILDRRPNHAMQRTLYVDVVGIWSVPCTGLQGSAGSEWKGQINSNLERAKIILFAHQFGLSCI